MSPAPWQETADDLLIAAMRALEEERRVIENEYMIRHNHLQRRIEILENIMDTPSPPPESTGWASRAHRHSRRR